MVLSVNEDHGNTAENGMGIMASANGHFCNGMNRDTPGGSDKRRNSAGLGSLVESKARLLGLDADRLLLGALLLILLNEKADKKLILALLYVMM